MCIMELEEFIEEMGNDMDDVRLIIGEYINSVALQIPLMKDLIVSRDFTTLEREAHSIKGGARNVMAQGMEYAARDLEMSARESRSEECELYLSVLFEKFGDFRNFIESSFI